MLTQMPSEPETHKQWISREGERLRNLLYEYSTQIRLVLFESVYRYQNYAQIAERPCIQAFAICAKWTHKY